MTSKEIATALELRGKARKKIGKLLHGMIMDGRIVQIRRNRFALGEPAGLVTGRIAMRRSGDGFLISDAGPTDVLVPFATAARLLGWYSGGTVSPRAVWCWVQAAGHQAMEQLQEQLQRRRPGAPAPREPLAADAGGLALGAGGRWGDGPVSARGRPPTGQDADGARSKWACWPAWASIARGPGRSSPGCISAGWWPSWGISMRSSRVCGLKPCARASARAPGGLAQ